MKRLILLSLMLTGCVYADSTPLDAPPGKWQCLAFDEQHKSYTGVGRDIKSAMLSAKSLCQRKSKEGITCETAQSFCEQGPISLIGDRCVVSDGKGHYWNTTGTNACKVAVSKCVQYQYLHGRASQCSVRHR